ncbi:MAG: adenosylhomocysteine nucleosidase [Chthoniobacteraceae bacterium]|nr:adenosylhomocysteine nucleosidase [Chthoniobacteraceae bacterium]
MIAVTFALPQESHDFIRALKNRQKVDGHVRGTLGAVEVCVVHIGVGPEMAARQTKVFLLENRPEWLLSTGFAGGLHTRLAVGALLAAENFSAPELLQKCKALPSRLVFGKLTTHPTVVDSTAHKTRLAQETGALAVDMETGAVAEACAAAGVPMLAIRVISDAATDPLPVPMEKWFDLKQQRPRPFALVGFLATHPAAIAPFARFISGLGPARRNLTRLLLEIVRA